MIKRLSLIVLLILALAFCGQCPGPPPPEPTTVKVTVCVTSNLLPNAYCPSVVEREYQIGSEPTAVCTIHGAPPQPEPKIRAYVGVYDLLGATGDWRAFLQAVRENGGAGLRVFVCYSWNGPQTGGSPYKQVGEWTHDNGITFPLYRLVDWNPAFWMHLSEILAEMKTLDLEAWLVVEDYCSLKGDSRSKYWNPMYSSEEALGPSTPGGVWGEAMRGYHALLIGKTIQTADAAGVKYLIEPMNEYDALDWPDADMIAWHQWAVDTIKANGVPASRIVGTSGRNPTQIAAQAAYYSPHGIGTPDKITATWNGIPASKLIYSSDGYWTTGTGDCDAKGRCGIGESTAPAVRDKILAVDAYGYEWLPRRCYLQNNDRATLSDFNPAVLKALSGI